jgi:putative membrane protein (TIGR04086 family)
MSDNKKIDIALIIKTIVIFLLTGVIAVFLFATIMYFLEGGYKYSPLYATISVAMGCFMSSLHLGLKAQKNGILIGLAVGGIVFVLITLVTLLINGGSVGIHILLRLIILLLTSLLGGIIGVNRKNEPKYI